ncbi:MAG: DEAD/DEAH box helicase [Acidobacteria bacterium]|nr:DEAD/DEAH box helicase [Acidobacteriota bacterium]
MATPSLFDLPAPTRSQSVETALRRFEELQARPNSPIRAIHHQPAREAQSVELPGEVDPRLREALTARGVAALYTHQAEAFAHTHAGRNVAVVTPTASGKTLCYNLPVLNRLLNEPGARAVYLFPTKALAEDQMHEFNAAVTALGADIKAFTYDGDTPPDARKAIRERAQVVLTNPDMLHTGILPHHTKWAKLFENLRYFVIDELHYYRGVYGSHLANVLRRVKRIAEFYGSKPQFICSSATIANPRELAQAICEEPFELVDRNGAPQGEKYFVFYNPPVVNQQLGIRRSYLHETRRLAVESIERGAQTLVFANDPLATEILVKYLKEASEKGPYPSETIRGYRGGYLPKERRTIERELREGTIRGVVATNALELGIDIGSLDSVIMAGYPGTIASTWQRAGRAGRRQRTSLAVLVASSAPLDQYIVEHPQYFFDRPPEEAHINANNAEILLNHLKCAAFELPIRDGEKFGPHDTAEPCEFLKDAGFLHHSRDAWHWVSDTYPADTVSLRAVTSDNFIVIERNAFNAGYGGAGSGEEVIAEVAFPAALTELHEKAIYLHEARQYQVEKFDYEQRKAFVRRVECDYFTTAIEHSQVKSLEEFAAADLVPGVRVIHGDVRVNRQVVGFKKIKFYTLENIGAGNLSMPEQEMHTTSFWLHFGESFLAQFADLTPSERQNGIAGLGNILRGVGALLVMCDPRDLGLAVSEDASQGQPKFEPDLFLYDNYPGGIGQSEPLYRRVPKLLEMARDLIAACPCESGCPSCVGPVGEVGDAGKVVAARLVAALLAPTAALEAGAVAAHGVELA